MRGVITRQTDYFTPKPCCTCAWGNDHGVTYSVIYEVIMRKFRALMKRLENSYIQRISYKLCVTFSDKYCWPNVLLAYVIPWIKKSQPCASMHHASFMHAACHAMTVWGAKYGAQNIIKIRVQHYTLYPVILQRGPRNIMWLALWRRRIVILS